MDLALQRKTAVVTGASKGIGLALARALADHGAKVVAASRSMTDEMEESISSPDVVHEMVDLGTVDGPRQSVERALCELGSVDVLVNNVGISLPRKGFLSLSDEDWDSSWRVNLLSAVRACRAAIPPMLDSGGGSIINITSLNSRQPHPMVVEYGVDKAALTNLIKALSEEFAGRGVRVNAIAPGFVRTPMWTDPGGFGEHVAALTGAADATEVIMSKAPDLLGITVGRFAEPDELCGLALLLASGAGRMMTGSEYLVDGGGLEDAVWPGKW